MSRPKILVSDKLDADAVQALHDFADTAYEPTLEPAALLAAVGGFDALVVRSRTQVTAEVIAAAALKAVARAGVGLDNIDTAACRAAGVTVYNAADAPAIAVAELAFGLALSLLRSIHKANDEVRRLVWNKNAYTGAELYGKTAGLVGVGNIGREFAKRATAFGMRVIAHDPYASDEALAAAGVARAADFDSLVTQADVISLHIPKTAETTHLFNAAVFARMKRTAILINAARGGIVDENALVDALLGGAIAGAALDVFAVEPTNNARFAEVPAEKLVLTPHLGASTAEAQFRVGMGVVDKLRRHFGA